MGNSLYMAIFNSYVAVYQRVDWYPAAIWAMVSPVDLQEDDEELTEEEVPNWCNSTDEKPMENLWKTGDGGFKHGWFVFFSISYMGYHPSHWRTHIF